VTASAKELETDLAPFRKLAGAPMAMTAHIVFEAWDSERCATLSPVVIGDIIRAEIGFDGLLFSDDLDMKALEGDRAQLAADVVAAGCDIALNCWGRFDEMKATVELLDDISDVSRARLDRAVAGIRLDRGAGDITDLVAKRDMLFAAL
jgi:beta-N-acetylhexosaminidase